MTPAVGIGPVTQVPMQPGAQNGSERFQWVRKDGGGKNLARLDKRQDSGAADGTALPFSSSEQLDS